MRPPASIAPHRSSPPLAPACAAAFALLAACAAAGPPSGPADLAGPATTDLAAPDLSTCVLGGPDHCGTCATVCPPGRDTADTRRVCTEPGPFGTCDMICLGEWYDVDGNLGNGCEAEDVPLQDAPGSAVQVTLSDATPTVTLRGQIFADHREHAESPTTRPNGRDDWYALNVTGTGSSSQGTGACLSLPGFAADVVFLVCIGDPGRTDFVPSSCRMVMGPSQVGCVTPPSGGDAGGPYYVRLQKLKGSIGPQKYSLTVQH